MKTEKRRAEPVIRLILSCSCDSRCGSSLHIVVWEGAPYSFVPAVKCRLLHGPQVQCMKK